jgi:hypothetical protein
MPEAPAVTNTRCVMSVSPFHVLSVDVSRLNPRVAIPCFLWNILRQVPVFDEPRARHHFFSIVLVS